MDVPVPPKIVLEQPAPCSDGQKAAETLRRALAPSVAPRAAWTVSVRFERTGTHLGAEGEITDELGAPVAHRAMKQDSWECSALARAIGVWASLVLDAEVERAAAPKAAGPAEGSSAGSTNARGGSTTSAGLLPQTSPTQVWPAPALPDKPEPEARLLLAHPEGERTVEVGLTTFLMGGTGSGVVAGPSAFVVFEVGRGWFLRPTVAIARTLEDLSPTSQATWGAARFDACGRVPGFYLEHRGIQLDLCAGAEGGFLEGSGWLLPFAAFGPSMGLRGELGGDLSAMVRAVAEVNLLLDSSTSGVNPDRFLGRAEVGLSWRIR